MIDQIPVCSWTRLRRIPINLLCGLLITMSVSSHDMRMVQELFPRMIAMDEGLIAGDGKSASYDTGFLL